MRPRLLHCPRNAKRPRRRWFEREIDWDEFEIIVGSPADGEDRPTNAQGSPVVGQG
jgi:hypothetical protein